jgi:hypothetical protein
MPTARDPLNLLLTQVERRGSAGWSGWAAAGMAAERLAWLLRVLASRTLEVRPYAPGRAVPPGTSSGIDRAAVVL